MKFKVILVPTSQFDPRWFPLPPFARDIAIVYIVHRVEEMSMSHNLLDQCVEAAVGRGMNMSVEYAPWIPVDLFQTLLVDVHEYAGCSWLTAIDSQLKSSLRTNV